MSGLSFFQNEGLHDSFGDSSAFLDFHDHEQHNQDKNITAMDRLSTKLALRRLLYRMERYEDLSVLQDDDDEDDDSPTNQHRDNSHYQSWQSLLVRAQLCQDLWRTVASENVDGGSDPALRKEYMELSQRVSVACKRAHVLAGQARERDLSAGRDKELVTKLFFSQIGDKDNASEQGNPDEGDSQDEGGENGEGVDYYEEFSEDDNDSDADDISARPAKRSNPAGDDNTNLQDLQKAQREQIEEAIAMMAKQMKESTQGIRKTLQKQNASTLNKLETVAEQNMEEVSKVATNVRDHVVANQRSSWATWTTMILIVGVFVFALLTIFTVPKHPDASLGRILSGGNENGPYARLVKKTIHGIQSVFDFDSIDSEDDNDNEVDSNEEEDSGWDQYDMLEEEVARQERERLEALVRDMQRGGRKSQDEEKRLQKEREQREEEERLKQQQQQAQEKLRQKQLEQEERRRQQQLEQERQEKARQEQLEQQKKQEEEKRKEQQSERERREKQRREKLEQRKQEKLKKQTIEEEEKLRKQKFEEEEKLRQRKLAEEEKVRKQKEQQRQKELKDKLRDDLPEQKVFARDLRAAAHSNNYQALEHYLELAPHLINEQDEDGWTALHIAVQAKHARIVHRLLLQYDDDDDENIHNIKPGIKLFGDKQITAFQLAFENYGLDHPVTDVFFDLEWYSLEDKERLKKIGKEYFADKNDKNYKGELPYSHEDVVQRINYNGFKKAKSANRMEAGTPSDDENSEDEEDQDDYDDETEEREEENPWGIEPEGDKEEEEDDGEDDNDDTAVSKTANQVNVDDIFASLQQAQQKQQEQVPDEDPVATDDIVDDNDSNSYDPTNLIEREGVAATMVSPRHFRLAAAGNDYNSLQRYLELAPEHINRQDKHGWTALHMAVHAKNERVVLLLLDQYDGGEAMSDLNIDPFVESYEEKRTAMDLALEMFGLDHPITDAFFDSGFYDRDDFEDWNSDEMMMKRQQEAEDKEQARLREEKLSEQKARIAKEKEAIRVKEARIAAVAEEERRVKKDKLDKLFGAPVEEYDDEIDHETIQERRSRLDSMLDEL